MRYASDSVFHPEHEIPRTETTLSPSPLIPRRAGGALHFSCSPLTHFLSTLGHRGCPRACAQEEVKGLSPAVIHYPVHFSQVGFFFVPARGRLRPIQFEQPLTFLAIVSQIRRNEFFVLFFFLRI